VEIIISSEWEVGTEGERITEKHAPVGSGSKKERKKRGGEKVVQEAQRVVGGVNMSYGAVGQSSYKTAKNKLDKI